MKRILVSVVSIMLIFTVIAVPALAATLDPDDYLVNSYEQDDTIVDVYEVSSTQTWRCDAVSPGSGSGALSSGFMESGAITVATIYPIGSDMVDVSGLVNDYVLNFSLDFSMDVSGTVGDKCYLSFVLFTYDSNLNRTAHSLSAFTSHLDLAEDNFSVGVNWVVPDGVCYVQPAIDVSITFVSGGSVVIDCDGFKITRVSDVPPPRGKLNPTDFIVDEVTNGDTNTLYVDFPASAFSSPRWYILSGDTYDVLKKEFGLDISYFFDTAYGPRYWVDLAPTYNDMIDISDIPTGTTVILDSDISHNNTFNSMGIRYQVYYFDAYGESLGVNVMAEQAGDFNNGEYSFILDKPDGAVYMAVIFQAMNVIPDTSATYTLTFNRLRFVCDIPTMVRVQQETGRTNQLLNELVNGDHGFDSSGSNFGSEADQLAGAGDQMNDAMSSGMNSLGSMTNSVAFTGTLTTLGSALGAVFEGHEVTICGVTGNPFTLLVTIFTIAILLPLGLKFIFRKWGSGGE